MFPVDPAYSSYLTALGLARYDEFPPAPAASVGAGFLTLSNPTEVTGTFAGLLADLSVPGQEVELADFGAVLTLPGESAPAPAAPLLVIHRVHTVSDGTPSGVVPYQLTSLGELAAALGLAALWGCSAPAGVSPTVDLSRLFALCPRMSGTLELLGTAAVYTTASAPFPVATPVSLAITEAGEALQPFTGPLTLSVGGTVGGNDYLFTYDLSLTESFAGVVSINQDSTYIRVMESLCHLIQSVTMDAPLNTLLRVPSNAATLGVTSGVTGAVTEAQIIASLDAREALLATGTHVPVEVMLDAVERARQL